jgi:two-component system alkaline phosphatase synthesis response regulator PhoP
MTQRILVVDDDAQIVRLVGSYLEQAGYQVLTAYDGETAIRGVRMERPDLVVLDVMLPDRDGWEVTRAIRSDLAVQATPIIMLTARVEDTDKIVGLEVGADDYITKPFNPREVVARVRAVLRRSAGEPVRRQILKGGNITMDLDRHEVTLGGDVVELTPAEFGLLRTFMENPDHAFTRSQLIDRGLGYSYEGMERTVDSHIKNLRKKIESDPARPIYIRSVFGVGYRFHAQDMHDMRDMVETEREKSRSR